MKKLLVVVLLFLSFLGKVSADDTLRVMFYNLLNYGNITDYCTSTNNSFIDKEKPLTRIVSYVNPDIFGVCELGSNSYIPQRILDSTMNIGNVKHYSKANYSDLSGSDLVSTLFYNDQKLALKSQYVLNTLVRDIILFKLYYLSPDLAQTHDTAFINCIVSHWKAGSTTADKNTRAQMTLNTMNWLETNASPGNYLFMGDFNVQSSSEQAFQNIVNYPVAAYRFFDPLSKLGTWNNSSSFADYHTQSTHTTSNGCASTGGMDDRFDFILASNSVISGTDHFQYLPGTYKAIGNDGNHFNEAINNGSNGSAPASIVNDLYQMSDHLPISLDLLVDQQGASIAGTTLQPFTIQINSLANNSLQFIIQTTKPSNINIEIFSLTGSKIQNLRLFAHTGKISETFSTTNWPSGMYFISITDQNGYRVTKKIVKL